MNEHEPLEIRIMNAIKKGEVRMRPRWHFALLTTLTVSGVVIVGLTLLYATSLAVFLLRDSGALFATDFGQRGWFELLRMLPWFLFLFILVFVVALEVLVRRFAFVYKKPLLTSSLAILTFIVVAGVFISLTPLHRGFMFSARHGQLPAPFEMLFAPPPPPDLYRGTIVDVGPSTFTLSDEGRVGTTTFVITPRTRLPYGSNFKVGERVVVIGDTNASGTVRAFGVREIDEYASP